jgi:hypothetical protein
MVVRITSFPKSDVAFFHWFDVVQPRLLHGGILNPNLLKMSPRVFIVIWKVQGSAFGVRSSAFLVFSVQGFFHEICVIGVICGWIVLEFSRYFVPTVCGRESCTGSSTDYADYPDYSPESEP